MLEFIKSEVENFKKNDFFLRMESISFVLFSLFLIDCSFSGSGRWLEFGPISIRMLLLILALGFAAPSILINLKEIVKNKYTIFLLIFSLFLIANTIRGLLANNRMDVLLSDLKGFCYLGMFPMVYLFMKKRKNIEFLMKCVIWANTALAALMIFVLVQYVLTGSYGGWNLDYFSKINFFFINPISASLLRIFPFSNLFFVCNCVFSFYFFLWGKSKWAWLYCVTSSLSLVALLMTFTRSSYLGLGLAILNSLMLCVLLRNEWKRILKYLGLTLVLFTVMLTTLNMMGDTNYLKYGLQRSLVSFGTEEIDQEIDDAEKQYLELTAQSDKLRTDTVTELNQSIKKAPIFGHGLGAAVKCRENGMTEYFYLDTINKMGIVGLLVYMLPSIYIACTLLQQVFNKKWKDNKREFSIKLLMFGGLLSFMAASAFNPYMNAALGITMYCLSMGAINFKENKGVKNI